VTEPAEFVRLYAEEFINKRNWAIADQIFGPEFLYHGPNGGEPRAGRDVYVKGSAGFLAAFPDWRAEVCAVAASGDLVTDRVHITATHTASINNVPPTGETIDDDCAHMWRVEDGVIVEGWLFCTVNMLRVMGLASRPAPAVSAGG
jgi:predicted SnoaL-like aldol condensation-catalyzing enzyme